MSLKGLMAVAALCLCVGTLSAQDTGGGGGNGGDVGGRRRGQGGGNFDPAQFQQRMMERIQERLGFTNETEWAAVQPLVQKVFDARREVGFGGFGRGGPGGGGGNNDQGGNRRGFGQPNPDAEALQKAIDDKVPAAQLKAAVEKYRAAHKEKEAKLAAAQENLRKVLTPRQEAQAILLGLMN